MEVRSWLGLEECVSQVDLEVARTSKHTIAATQAIRTKRRVRKCIVMVLRVF